MPSKSGRHNPRSQTIISTTRLRIHAHFARVKIVEMVEIV
jgi:hypothetical protein